MEYGHEKGHEKGVNVLQVVEAPLEALAPHRDDEGPEGCKVSETQLDLKAWFELFGQLAIFVLERGKIISMSFRVTAACMVPPYDGDADVVLCQALQQ